MEHFSVFTDALIPRINKNNWNLIVAYKKAPSLSPPFPTPHPNTIYWVNHRKVAQLVKNLPIKQETWVWALGWERGTSIPWRRERPSPVFRPGESHGLYRPWGAKSQTRPSAFHFHRKKRPHWRPQYPHRTCYWRAGGIRNRQQPRSQPASCWPTSTHSPSPEKTHPHQMLLTLMFGQLAAINVLLKTEGTEALWRKKGRQGRSVHATEKLLPRPRVAEWHLYEGEGSGHAKGQDAQKDRTSRVLRAEVRSSTKKANCEYGTLYLKYYLKFITAVPQFHNKVFIIFKYLMQMQSHKVSSLQHLLFAPNHACHQIVFP